MAEVNLSKWGNSSGIRLPKEILNQGGFEVGDIINIEVVDKQLVLNKRIRNHQFMICLKITKAVHLHRN